MKNIHRSLLALLASVTLTAACEDVAVQDITAPLSSDAARIKFFNFGVGSPGVNFYSGSTKLTGISSTTCAVLTDANREQCTTVGAESTAGVNFGGVGASGLYIMVPAGQHTFAGRIAATVDKDLAISGVTMALEPGKAYSFYQSGIYDATTKQVDAFVVEDPFIPNFDYSTAYVRFVHAISNADPMTLTVVERTDGEQVVVGGQVAYRNAGQFTPVPPGAYDLTTRYAGQTGAAITRANVSFARGRVYTITARGNINTTSTILLDNTLNR